MDLLPISFWFHDDALIGMSACVNSYNFWDWKQ